MVWGFEHRVATDVHAHVVDAYRYIVTGRDDLARLELAEAAGSLTGAFRGPGARFRRDFQLAIWHPEIDQSHEEAS
jgi:hypothetical protein